MASALHYLAGEGMVHLDVKPDNVVMGAPPRLIDLSVTRTVADAARLRHPTGTDAYMAPELCAAGTAGGVGLAGRRLRAGRDAAARADRRAAVPAARRARATSRDPGGALPASWSPRRRVAAPHAAGARGGACCPAGLARDPGRTARRPAELAGVLEPLVAPRSRRRMLLGRRA